MTRVIVPVDFSAYPHRGPWIKCKPPKLAAKQKVGERNPSICADFDRQ
jgi:hypothetical protein